MSLEKRLAEIEVFADEIKSRANENVCNSNYSARLKGVLTEAFGLRDAYFRAKSAMKSKNDIRPNIAVGDVASSAKNLVDSLSKFTQVMYGNHKVNLAKPERNLVDCPLSLNGLSFVEEMALVHDHTGNGDVTSHRNKKGHADTHLILKRDKTFKSNYGIETSEGLVDGMDWLNKHSVNYLSLVSLCLESIVKKEQVKLDPQSSERRFLKVLNKRLANYVRDHTRSALAYGAVGLVSLGIGAGVVGTILVDEFTKDLNFERSKSAFLGAYGANSRNGVEVYRELTDVFCGYAFGMDFDEFGNLSDSERKKLTDAALREHPEYVSRKFKSLVESDPAFFNSFEANNAEMNKYLFLLQTTIGQLDN